MQLASALGRLLSAVTGVELSLLSSKDAQASIAAGWISARSAAGWRVRRGECRFRDSGEIAIDAFRRYGKGRHRAGLNIGDCFSYALAIAMDQELLFKGDDFIHTDVRAVSAAAR